MAPSLINIQRDIILDAIRHAGGNDWKILVVDENSRKLLDNSVNEDDILNNNVTNIEQIEHRRPSNKDMDALYILSALPHILDCLMADLERQRYRRFFVVWTAILDQQQRSRLDRSQIARDLIVSTRTLNVDFYPRESQVVTFRDPWSFPVLFHPACNNLIREHLEGLSRKIVSLCVVLGEYPIIRYYRPRTPTHEASVLCSHLARFVQDELDRYAQFNRDFPPQSPRPRGVLLIVDRSMDLFSPLLHEFTYQAMAHDLLPIKDGDKVTYKTVINEGAANEEVKDMEITDHDRIWVDYRHLHMKDVLERLAEDFTKFRAANPHYAESEDSSKVSVNTIKDMLAGLSDFQAGKNAYTLHLNMAQECMKLFQEHNLLETSSVEQSLSTGLDEDYKKPKNLAIQLVRLLDDESIIPPDRLRLILMYLIYRDGLLGGDIRKLLAHAKLPPQDGEVVYNLDLLGARVEKPLKDNKPANQPIFQRKSPTAAQQQEVSLSRFEPNVKLMLEEQIKGTLDPTIFPFTRPHTDGEGGMQDQISQSSLRSAKPTWARTRSSGDQPRQRILVFMAGGASFAEARACYEITQASAKDVFLASSHMLSPAMFLRQLGDLNTDKRRLDIPAERPRQKAPAHLFEKDTPPPQQKSVKPQAPPTAAMANMSLKGNQPPQAPSNGTPSGGKPAKKEKEKKKHHFFR
ncbi:Sec1 family superfamily [Talaromyces proteolyticus]|uniref:Sec1 family superfamily n=1 Tax=Talaromyces proteolyticus TaxID=1131652 RepID=A0AAD4KU56_9EURO|nr:Sec1 family superfamily [Talaromyces proteolyticus]KAH8696119.1 Sec1 family superfamily [Talaromyces proteolyticus]